MGKEIKGIVNLYYYVSLEHYELTISIELNTIDGRTLVYSDIKGALFDLDGTLVDTLDLHIQSFKWILSQYQIKVSDQEMANFMGRTPQDIIKIFLPHLDESEIWEASIRKEEHLFDLLPEANSIKINPGAIEFLTQLGDLGIPRVVISSTHRSLVNRLLSNVKLIELLDEMVPGDEITHGKPNPEPFMKGVEKIGIPTENVFGVGDSIFDSQSCRAANINFIGITTGKTNYEKFRRFDTDTVISSFENIRVI